MMNPNPESWDQWGRHVLKELERHTDELHQQGQTLALIQAAIAGLQVKAGLWGAIAGAIPAVAALLFILLKERG